MAFRLQWQAEAEYPVEATVQTVTMMGFGVVLVTLLCGFCYVLFRKVPSRESGGLGSSHHSSARAA